MKKFLLFILLALVISCNKQKEAELQYDIGCVILDKSFNVLANFPGEMCDYRKDGYRVSSHQVLNEIRFFDNHDNLVWSKPYYVHHFAKFSPDGEYIYISADEVLDYQGNKTRFDVIKKLKASNGDLVAEWKLHDHLDEIQKLFPWKFNPEEHRTFYEANTKRSWLKYDYLHFNSLNFIPKNPKETQFKFLKEGNILLTPGPGLALFFTPDLKLEHSILLDKAIGVNHHDMQITRDGDLLLYKNWTNVDSCPSSLQLFIIPTLKLHWFFNGNMQSGPFCSTKYGSVQLLEDRSFLYSDISHGGRVQIIKTNGDLVKQFYHPYINLNSKLPEEIFKAKLLDLNAFLEARKK